MPEIHVVVASVPWREENLVLLLEDLKSQTLTPASITTILDGYDDEGFARVKESHGDLNILRNQDVGSGNWARWLHAQGLDGVVALIDDDFRVFPEYLERLYESHVRHDEAVVSFHGKLWGQPWLNGAYEDSRIDVFGSGLSMFNTRSLVGLQDDHDFKMFLEERGTDDGFMSYFFWSKNIPIFFVGGQRPVSHDAVLAHDKRSRGYTQRDKRNRLLNHLRKERGWLKSRSVVLYYSEGSMPAAFQRACFKRLVEVIPREMLLRCVVPNSVAEMIEQEVPADLDVTIIRKECENRGRADLVSRLHLGVADLHPSTPIALAEHDVIYGPGHFEPFEVQADSMWPAKPGLRLHIDNVYRYCGRPLLSMRGSAACVSRIGEELEPSGGKIIAGWKGNYIDIRWNGNFTVCQTDKPLGTALDHAPAPEALRSWVDRLLESGEDDSSIRLKALPERKKPEASVVQIRPQAKAVYNPLEAALARRKSRYVRHHR